MQNQPTGKCLGTNPNRAPFSASRALNVATQVAGIGQTVLLGSALVLIALSSIPANFVY